MTIWFLRLTWVTLPFTAAPAVTDAVAGWSDAPRVVVAVLLWAAWTVGVVALLAPRPLALTALRTIAPLFVVVSALAATNAPAAPAVIAIVATLVNAVLAVSPATALTCAAGIAYGTEVRHPLKVPPALLLAPLPIAVLLVGAGVSVGPLLLADGSYVAGAVVLPVGLVVAWFLARSLHTLSRRWAIIVPAGLVVVDSMTLVEPVLFTREQIVLLGPSPRALPPEPEAVDLRLGAALSALSVETHDPVGLGRIFANRRGARTLSSRQVAFAPVAPGALTAVAAERRIATRPRDADAAH